MTKAITKPPIRGVRAGTVWCQDCDKPQWFSKWYSLGAIYHCDCGGILRAKRKERINL